MQVRIALFTWLVILHFRENLQLAGAEQSWKQAGSELGQAQPKLGLIFTSILGRFGLVKLVRWI